MRHVPAGPSHTYGASAKAQRFLFAPRPRGPWFFSFSTIFGSANEILSLCAVWHSAACFISGSILGQCLGWSGGPVLVTQYSIVQHYDIFIVYTFFGRVASCVHMLFVSVVDWTSTEMFSDEIMASNHGALYYSIELAVARFVFAKVLLVECKIPFLNVLSSICWVFFSMYF